MDELGSSNSILRATRFRPFDDFLLGLLDVPHIPNFVRVVENVFWISVYRMTSNVKLNPVIKFDVASWKSGMPLRWMVLFDPRNEKIVASSNISTVSYSNFAVFLSIAKF